MYHCMSQEEMDKLLLEIPCEDDEEITLTEEEIKLQKKQIEQILSGKIDTSNVKAFKTNFVNL